MIVLLEILLFILGLYLLAKFSNAFLFKESRTRNIIKNSKITREQWDEAYHQLSFLRGLNVEEKQSLEELCLLFMHHKVFEGAKGFQITPYVMLVISLQACLPILRLGLSCYDNFSTIIVYPYDFITNRQEMDENGVVDHDRTHTLGEAWLRGPVILSWPSSEEGGIEDGSNLVIHEFTHKLDMQNGVANGFPPLHDGVESSDWVREFSKAYDYFQDRCNGDQLHGFDCYAASNPAEFFSVFSEMFFEKPDKVRKYFPEVHNLLELYYRQTPISRLNK